MYKLDVVVQGYPGRSLEHGALGWCTVGLLRSGPHIVLVDPGAYSYRGLVRERLAHLGVKPEDVTAILLTHLHWDHSCNYPLYPNARVYVSRIEMHWAAGQKPGESFLPEFHVEKLSTDPRCELFDDGDEIVPGIVTMATPGHTPGHAAFVVKGDDGTLIFTGDAVKYQAEMATCCNEFTLDEAQTKTTIARIRAAAARDPRNVIVGGHDRLFSWIDGACVVRTPLVANIRTRLGASFEDFTFYDLTAAVPQPAKH